jgi:hypothetical protein
MTLPLDAARRLVAGPKPTYYEWVENGIVGRLGADGGTVPACAYCRQLVGQHTPECPVAALPKIVEALKAAEALAQSDGHLTQDLACDPWACAYCQYRGGHGDDCLLGALVVALGVSDDTLKGETA